jgi:hypothetical protein
LAKDLSKQINRLPQGFTGNREGYDNAINSCNNLNVEPGFKISHDNSVHNCNSNNVYSKYYGADHKKTVYVDENREFTLPNGILSNITPAIFESSVGECVNGVNVTNQNLKLNYSIKHSKEDIKIEEIFITSVGNGILKYTANKAGPYDYNLSNKSNDINERSITIDEKGNVKMNKMIIFTNPDTINSAYIVHGYTSNNNLKNLKSGDEISSSKYRLTLGSSWNNSTLFFKTKNTAGNEGVKDFYGETFKYTEHYHKNKGSQTENVFILYKIKSHDLPKLLFERRIYANIEKTNIAECNTNKGSENLCYIRAIHEKLVGDENVNFKNIQIITMNEFKQKLSYKIKYINNDTLQNVPGNINEIRIFLIKSLRDIHKKIAGAMSSGASEGFKGYDKNVFSGYNTLESMTSNNDDEGTKRELRLLDKMRIKNERINAKSTKMVANADKIRGKLNVLTGYQGSIHNNNVVSGGGEMYDEANGILSVHDRYDAANNLIPFMFDTSDKATDYYKGRGADGKPDRKAKIDVIKEDLNEMIYQQNALYTMGSITSATLIIAAILLARNSSS